MTTYSFIFQCNEDGSANISYQPQPPSGKKSGSVRFKKKDTVLPVLLPPPGSSETMSALSMNFTEQAGPASPFGDGTNSVFNWQPGDPATETVDTYGAWGWSATVRSSSGATYFLPDPELEVGVRPGAADE